MMRAMKKNNIRHILVLAVLILLTGYVIALARTIVMWKWVDKKGVAHYTDELWKVPEKYQSKAVKIEIEVNDPVQPSGPPPPPPPPPSQQNSEEQKRKAEWQRKAHNAVAKVKNLEKAIELAETECAALHQKWASMPVQANRQALAACNKRLEELNISLVKAREYRDKGIYQEAMQQGVPIDWIDGILKGD